MQRNLDRHHFWGCHKEAMEDVVTKLQMFPDLLLVVVVVVVVDAAAGRSTPVNRSNHRQCNNAGALVVADVDLAASARQ